MTRFKVCFVAGTLGQGGAERQLYYIVRAAQEMGIEACVLCLTRGEFWERHIQELGIPVVWVGGASTRFERLTRIVSEVRNGRPDVLQSQHFYTNLYVAAAARLNGIPEIGALRNDGVSEVADMRGILGPLCLRAPRTVAANSERGIENAVALGMPRSRLRLLPNVVDTAHFHAPARAAAAPVRLLVVGRLVPQKRVDRFLRVLADVRTRSSVPVVGSVVGDGPQRAELESIAAALGLDSGGVTFHGSATDMRPVYHAADVLVLTSDHEGTPNVVLEAMAAGLPVVATRVGGLAGVMRDGETGWLVDPADERALADAVLRLVNDRALRAEHGSSARRYVDRYHALPRLSEELRELYRAVHPRAFRFPEAS